MSKLSSRSPTDEAGSRPNLGYALAAVALLAAHLALVSEIVRSSRGKAGWALSALIVATNLAACLGVAVVVRFRLIPLMVMASTAALTEAFLWRSATSGRDNAWIVLVAAIGLLLLAAWWYGVRLVDRQVRDRR